MSNESKIMTIITMHVATNPAYSEFLDQKGRLLDKRKQYPQVLDYVFY